LIELGMAAEKQQQIKVHYFVKNIGKYYADLVVDNLMFLNYKLMNVY